MGIVAAVYVPSMPWAEQMPEPEVSADGGFLVPERHSKALIAAFEECGMIVGPRKLVNLGPMTFANMT